MSDQMPPGWYSGKDGIESYWDGAKWTQGPNAPVPASPPAQPTNKRSGSGCAAIVVLFIAVALIGSMFKACGGGSNASGIDEYDVQATCKDLVGDQLKNPSTAQFSDEIQTTMSAGGTVVAENALGGKVTYAYSCTRSGETVTLISLNPR